MSARLALIRVALAVVCQSGLLGSATAQNGERPALSIGSGPTFFLQPQWLTAGNRAFVPGWCPSIRAQLTWPSSLNARLQFNSFLRNGWWATESMSSYYGADCNIGGQVYQLGAGLRYTDFVNLGRWLEPFGGLNASVGYAAAGRGWTAYAPYFESTAPPRRWTALLGAELGLKGWLTDRGGPVLTLEVYRSLRPYFKAPLVETAYLYGPPGQPPQAYEVRTRSLRGQAAVLLGWHWQLGAGPGPRRRWHTPRYSEPAVAPTDSSSSETEAE